MGTVAIDLDDARLALEHNGRAVADLLRRLASATARIDNSTWTVRDAAVHLAADLATNTDAVRGLSQVFEIDPSLATRDRMVELNGQAVREVGPTDPGVLADLVDKAVTGFLDAAAGRDDGEMLATPWYGEGTAQDLDTMACVMLGEVVMHGYDIAEATGSTWVIDPHHAALVLCGVADMLPLYVDPEAAAGVQAVYDIRVRGGQAFTVTADAGRVRVSGAGGRVDCHISADPVALLLVAYGRQSQWGPIARGDLVAWGRRPWLALSFRDLFTNP